MVRKGLVGLTLLGATLALLLVAVPVFAQQNESAQEQASDEVKAAELLTWVGDRDWGKGVLLALGGLVGGLAVAFPLIGGAVPGTAGKANIDADQARLTGLSKRLQKLIEADEPDAAVIQAVSSAVNALRDDLGRERRQQFALALLFYLVLGAAAAAILAEDLLDGLVIGAGGTGLLGSLGLKTDFAKRAEVKDKALTETAEAAQDMAAADPDPNNPALAEVERTVEVALAL